MEILKNIKSIRIEKGINQENVAEALSCDVTNYSKIESGKQHLRVSQLEKIAECLSVNIIDIFTYPKVFVDKDSIKNNERIAVTFEVSPDKKDILLNLVMKDQKDKK